MAFKKNKKTILIIGFHGLIHMVVIELLSYAENFQKLQCHLSNKASF